MKIIENNWWLNKEITYKGNKIIVPVWANWIAVDSLNSGGRLLAFETKPFVDGPLGGGWWELSDFDSDFTVVGKVELEDLEDWKESLEFVGEDQ